MAQKKGIEVNVDLADGVIRTVGVVVHDPDLQRLILELEVVHLKPDDKDDDPLTPDLTWHSLEPVRVPGRVQTLPVDVCLVRGVCQLHLCEGVRGVRTPVHH